jgi:long-chain acyl-CoA synthetase
MSEVGITSVELSKFAKERIRGSIGMPFDSVEYRINEEGHLLIKGSSLCSEVIIDGKEEPMPLWFDTSDIVSTDEDGRYYIRGRVSDIVFGDDGENLANERNA